MADLQTRDKTIRNDQLLFLSFQFKMAVVSGDTGPQSIERHSDSYSDESISRLDADGIIEFQSNTDLNQFKGARIQGFHSALFVGGSLWICGWHTSSFGQKNIVFLNVQGDDYDVLSKNEFKYHGADQPLVMFTTREIICFAKRDGNEIHSFNTRTQEFHRVFQNSYYTISALCGIENYVYILDKYQPNHIEILDSTYHALGRIDTGLGTILDRNVYMCSVVAYPYINLPKENIVLCTSFPLGTVRLLQQHHGVVWQINIQNYLELPPRFNPCSVSVTPSGRILFADRYSDQVSKTCIIEEI